MYVLPVTYSSVNGHLDYFQQKDMNNAAMNSGIQIHAWVPVFSSFAHILRGWMAGSNGRVLCSTFWGRAILFSTVFTFVLSTFPPIAFMSPCPCQHLLLSILLSFLNELLYYRQDLKITESQRKSCSPSHPEIKSMKNMHYIQQL